MSPVVVRLVLIVMPPGQLKLHNARIASGLPMTSNLRPSSVGSHIASAACGGLENRVDSTVRGLGAAVLVASRLMRKPS